MQTTAQFQNYLKIYMFIAVAMGIVQMANYQVHRRSDISTSNQTLQNTTSHNLSSVDPHVKIYATMRLEPIVRSVFQQNSLNPTIQQYELQGVDWIYNICINYGHIVLCIFLYNHFKSAVEPSYKIKILVGGAIAVFGWIYLANHFAIQKVTVLRGERTVLYHNDKQFDKGKFQTFVKENAEEFEIKKVDEQVEVKQTPIEDQNIQRYHDKHTPEIEIDPETGNVYTNEDM